MPNLGSWCWFSDPRSIYSVSKNRTYVGWVSPTGDVIAAQIDGVTQQMTQVVLHAAFESDDHDNPAFLEMPDGRIAIFYTRHGALNSDVYMRVTDTAGNLSTLGAERGLGTTAWSKNASYANPIYQPGSGRVFVFFRDYGGSAGTVRWCMVGSENGLASFSGGYPFWTVPANTCYLKCVCNNSNRAEFLLTDNHPTHGITSVYQISLTWNGTATQWKGINGTSLSMLPPAIPSVATLVLNGNTVGNSWINQVEFAADGNPVALLSTYPGNALPGRYRFAKLVGSTWQTFDICNAGGSIEPQDEPNYLGGICFDGRDTNKVYLSIGDATGWRIEQWQTTDGGQTWAFAATISPADVVNKQWRPYSPKGYGAGSPSVLWWKGTYTDFTNFNGTLQIVYDGAAPPPPPPPLTPQQQLVAACQGVAADGTVQASVKTMAQKLSALYQ